MAFGLNRAELIGRLRRRRHHQPLEQRRTRRQPLDRHRRGLRRQAERRAGGEDRVAPGRDLPARARGHVRKTRTARAGSSTWRASSRPGAGRRRMRTSSGSRPRYFSSRAGAVQFLDKVNGERRAPRDCGGAADGDGRGGGKRSARGSRRRHPVLITHSHSPLHPGRRFGVGPFFLLSGRSRGANLLAAPAWVGERSRGAAGE